MDKMNKGISKVVGCEVFSSERYENGFSFCVATELEAYKAVYAYRKMTRVTVHYSTNLECWLVQVYK